MAKKSTNKSGYPVDEKEQRGRYVEDNEKKRHTHNSIAIAAHQRRQGNDP